MKFLLSLVLWWVAAASAAGQVIQIKAVTTRTVPTTKQTRLDREMLRFLVFTHEVRWSS